MLKKVDELRTKWTNWWLEEERIGISIIKIAFVTMVETTAFTLAAWCLIGFVVWIYNMFHEED